MGRAQETLATAISEEIVWNMWKFQQCDDRTQMFLIMWNIQTVQQSDPNGDDDFCFELIEGSATADDGAKM